MKKIMVLPFLAGFLAGLLSVLAVLAWMRSGLSFRDAVPPTRLKVAQADSGRGPDHVGAMQAVAPSLRQRVVPVVLRECILPAPEPDDVDGTGIEPAVQPRQNTGTEPAGSVESEPAGNATIAPPLSAPSSEAQDAEQPPRATARTACTDASLYARALKSYESGRYARSREEFALFTRTFPHSPLMPNALYWTGETWYAQRRFDKAGQAFAQVSSRYPRHAKSPDALLKQAYSALRAGDSALARRLLDSLEARYPDSRASVLGRRALHGMPGRGAASSSVTARG